MHVEKQTPYSGEPPISALSLEPMLAKAFADRVGASLRQVQMWTDQGVIQCLPGTKHQGRGRKRLYDPIELPIGALATVLARFGFSVGMLHGYGHTVRDLLHEGQPEGVYELRPREWFRAAFRGRFESWMVLIPETVHELLPGESGKGDLVAERIAFSWEDSRTLPKLLKTRRAATLVNVREVISEFVR